MLEKPEIRDDRIKSCMNEQYGLPVAQVSFLPWGVDKDAAAYRIVAKDGKVYFAKLRQGVFHEASVILPRYLSDQDIPQIIAPPSPPRQENCGPAWAALG